MLQLLNMTLINYLQIGFIQPIEETTWLSPIVVVPKKNGKLKICVDYIKLNKATKKDLYPLQFFDEVLNTITMYKVYSFLDGYSRHHQKFIAPKDRYNFFCNRLRSFCLDDDAIWCQKWATNFLESS
jgi:hypothetical protein